MKFIIPALCFAGLLMALQPVFAASPPPTGPQRPGENTRMAAPLAEMMFYEAAEQAVEDSYARIIPDTEEKAEKNQDNRGSAAEQKKSKTKQD